MQNETIRTEKRIGLSDIARHVNVSVSLVSRILNKKPGTWASEEVQQRILDCARDMNYRPHAAARALGSGKSHAVVMPMFVPDGDVGRHGMVIGTLARYLSQNGYHLILDVARTQAGALSLLENVLQMRGCDAAVLWGDESDVPAQGRLLAQYGVPFIAKGYYDEEHPNWPQVEFDHVFMMEMLLRHLAERGHERIAYIGFAENGPIYVGKLSNGFSQAHARILKTAAPDRLRCAHDGAGTCAEWLEALLAGPRATQPTALIIATGEERMWMRTELALAKHGRRIGPHHDDLTVTGLRHTTTPLLFGQAEAFPYYDLSLLAEATCEQLLLPLLSGTPPEHPVVRLVPSLLPVPSLEIALPNVIVPPFL